MEGFILFEFFSQLEITLKRLLPRWKQKQKWRSRNILQYFGKNTKKSMVESAKVESNSLDWEKIVKNIEKGELRLKRMKEMKTALDLKVKSYANPWREMKLNYGKSKGKTYTEEEDRFLVINLPPSLKFLL